MRISLFSVVELSCFGLFFLIFFGVFSPTVTIFPENKQEVIRGEDGRDCKAQAVFLTNYKISSN